MQPTSVLNPAASAAASSVSVRQGRWSRALTISAFVLPTLIVYVLFVLFPIVQAMFYSLWDWKGLGPLQKFVGLDNYRRALGDGVFQMAIQHNLTIVVLSLVIQLPI